MVLLVIVLNVLLYAYAAEHTPSLKKNKTTQRLESVNMGADSENKLNRINMEVLQKIQEKRQQNQVR